MNARVSKFRGIFSHIGGDLTGGITAAVIALPLALAFGVTSGLGAVAGLYGAIACGIFAALFGGTPGQVSGPTGPMTVVVASLVALHTGNPDLIFASVVAGGILQIVLGLFRTGQLIHYVPYPVISGFMSGIGFIIIFLQIPPLFGLTGSGSVLESLVKIPGIPGSINPQAAIIGLGTLGLIFLFKRLSPKLPASLAALILATVASLVLGFDIADIGPISGGLPKIHIPTFGLVEIQLIMSSAIALAVLGSLDSLLTSIVVDRITHQRHNSDKELVGQGIGNIVSGLIGGLPGAGATMRSVVNIQSGGRTNLSGVIHGVILLAILMGLGFLTEHIPLACLAGILIHVGITIIDYRGLKSIPTAPKADVGVMLIVLGLTIFVDLIVAVIAGVSLASILFAKRLSDSDSSYYGVFRELPDGPDKDRHPHLEHTIYMYTFRGPLFFGEAKNFSSVMSSLPNIRYVLLRFDHVPMIDQTGAYAVEDTIAMLQSKGIRVYLVHPSADVKAGLEKISTGHGNIASLYYDSLEGALEAIHQVERSH